MPKKFLVPLIILVIAGATAIGLSVADDNTTRQQDSAQDTPAQSQTTTPTPAQSSTVSYKGIEGKTALELLKSAHKVETKTFEGMGEYVVSIDGRAPADSSEFWAFYVNDKQAQVGAGDYVTKDGEKIEWKLEKVQ